MNEQYFDVEQRDLEGVRTVTFSKGETVKLIPDTLTSDIEVKLEQIVDRSEPGSTWKTYEVFGKSVNRHTEYRYILTGSQIQKRT